MFEDEVDDRRRVVESMGMVFETFFYDDFYVPAEFFVALPQNHGIFFIWDNLVSVSAHMEERNTGISQRFQVGYGVLVIGKSLRF